MSCNARPRRPRRPGILRGAGGGGRRAGSRLARRSPSRRAHGRASGCGSLPCRWPVAPPRRAPVTLRVAPRRASTAPSAAGGSWVCARQARAGGRAARRRLHRAYPYRRPADPRPAALRPARHRRQVPCAARPWIAAESAAAVRACGEVGRRPPPRSAGRLSPTSRRGLRRERIRQPAPGRRVSWRSRPGLPPPSRTCRARRWTRSSPEAGPALAARRCARLYDAVRERRHRDPRRPSATCARSCAHADAAPAQPWMVSIFPRHACASTIIVLLQIYS